MHSTKKRSSAKKDTNESSKLAKKVRGKGIKGSVTQKVVTDEDTQVNPLCVGCEAVIGESVSCRCTCCERVFHRECVLYLGNNKMKPRIRIKCPYCLFQERVISNHDLDSTLLEEAKTFNKQGYVVPTCLGFLSREAKDLQVLIMNEFDRLSEAFAYQTRVLDPTEGFSNFRQRGSGRFEIIPHWLQNYVDEKLSPLPWLPLVRAILGPDFVSHGMGVFISTPGAEAQKYHTDGPCLDYTRDLPCHALNVFVALDDVGPKNGTEIIPESHRKYMTESSDRPLFSKKPLKKKKSSSTPIQNRETFPRRPTKDSVVPVVTSGDIYLFDYRVRHRGVRNATGMSRPCVYFTYTVPWYHDVYNFSKRRYRSALIPVAE